jgi:hypothetical protein
MIVMIVVIVVQVACSIVMKKKATFRRKQHLYVPTNQALQPRTGENGRGGGGRGGGGGGTTKPKKGALGFRVNHKPFVFLCMHLFT